MSNSASLTAANHPFLVAIILAGSISLPAHATISFNTAVTDTPTDFFAGWNWDGSGGVANYFGTNWNIIIGVVPGLTSASILTMYQHLSGPDGESAETWHVFSTAGRVYSSFGSVVTGNEHHLAGPGELPQHVNAHLFSYSLSVPSADNGAASLSVQHLAAVPEPTSIAYMLCGILCFASLSAYRRR